MAGTTITPTKESLTSAGGTQITKIEATPIASRWLNGSSKAARRLPAMRLTMLHGSSYDPLTRATSMFKLMPTANGQTTYSP